MKSSLLVMAAVLVLCLGNVAQADVFHMGQGLTSLEMVTVSDPNNQPDTRYAAPGYGSVGYTYSIGKFEVTAAQYTEFLNAVAKTDDTYGLYNWRMSDTSSAWLGCNIQRTESSGDVSYSVPSEWANKPVNYVSFWDAARFVNWLQNGQPTGLQNASTTEDGAYTLNGYAGSDGRDIQRNAGARWMLPSVDEWYKAAYYKGNGTSAGYWEYPTQSNSVPGNRILNPDSGNSANYSIDNLNGIGYFYRTNVGEFENSASAYGTYDQAGNVCEWTENLWDAQDTYRRIRGGSWENGEHILRASWLESYDAPTSQHNTEGFRVVEVPEPSSITVLVGGLGLLGIRRRRA